MQQNKLSFTDFINSMQYNPQPQVPEESEQTPMFQIANKQQFKQPSYYAQPKPMFSNYDESDDYQKQNEEPKRQQPKLLNQNLKNGEQKEISDLKAVIEELEKSNEFFKKKLKNSFQQIQILEDQYEKQIQEKDQEIQALHSNFQRQIEKKDQRIQILEDKIQEMEADLNAKPSEKQNFPKKAPGKIGQDQNPHTSVLSIRHVPKGMELELSRLVSHNWNVVDFKKTKDLTSAVHSFVTMTFDSRDAASGARVFLDDLKNQSGFEWLSEILYIQKSGSVLRISKLPKSTDQVGLKNGLSEFGNILNVKLSVDLKDDEFLFGTVEFEEKGAAQQGKMYLEELKTRFENLSELSCWAL